MILGVITIWLALAAAALGLAHRDEETLVYVREIAPTLVTREAGDRLPRELHFQLTGSDVKLNLRLRRNNLDNENAAVYVIRTGADGKDVFVKQKLAPEINTGLYQDPDHGGSFSVRCTQGQDRSSHKSLWGTLYIDGAPHTIYPEEKHLTRHASADSTRRYILRRESAISYKRADPIQVTDHPNIRETDSTFRSSVYTSPSGSRTFGVELLAVVDYRIYKDFEEKIQRRRALNYPWLPYPLDPAYNYNHNQNSNYNNNNYNNNNYNQNNNNINNGYDNNNNKNGYNNNNNNNGYNNNYNNNNYNNNNYNNNKYNNNNYNKYPNNNYTTNKNAAPIETRKERVLREIRQYYTHVLNGVDLRYASLDADDFSIYLKVAGLIIADTPDKSPWSESRARSGAAYGSTRDIIDATPTLKDFRDWVQSADKLPTPADHAMLFTGYNLFQDGSTSTLGVAYMKGVCGSWKTSLIQDHGNMMSTIETATHELGHNLGASHDGYKNACKSNLQFIMAQYAGTRHDAIKLNPWKWSTCSVTYFRKFLENLVKGSNNCLANEAKHGDEYEFHLHTSQLAGQIYTVPEQCQLIQDSTSQPCYNMFRPEEVCQKMYCRKTSGTCAKYLAARGTSCGDMRWCIDGSCQYDPRAPRQING